MSRQSVMPQRNLTLTEELERVEQSITLTLQEIDHNFSKAHRIVTGNIIPIVEQYAKHSDTVWEGSKFWKQFFEASANVSLATYEEPPEEDLTAVGQNETEEPQDQYTTPAKQKVEAEDTITETEERPSARFDQDRQAHSSIMDSPSVSVAMNSTTPRQRQQQQQQSKAQSKQRASNDESSFAEYPSPYETLKAEMTTNTTTKNNTTTSRTQNTAHPTTPGHQTQTLAFTDSSPIPIPPSTTQNIPTTADRQNNTRQNTDRLLHNVLDKNYRLQATPHTARRKAAGTASSRSASPIKRSPQKQSSQPTTTKRNTNPALDSSPFSPGPAAPQLRSEIFGSPAMRGAGAGARNRGPRTPGVSVQPDFERKSQGRRTPGYRNPAPTSGEGLFSPSPAGGAAGTTAASKTGASASQQRRRNGDTAPRTPGAVGANNMDVWDDDNSDISIDTSLSPPKTLQFHIPQPANRVLQTPAREASRRIVEDLMRSAGVGVGDSTVENEEEIGYDEGERLGRRGDVKEGDVLRGMQGMRFEDEEEGADEIGDGSDGFGEMEREEASPSVVRQRKQEEDDF